MKVKPSSWCCWAVKIYLQTLRQWARFENQISEVGLRTEIGGWRVWRQRGLHGRACLRNNTRKERRKGRKKDGKRRKERRKEVREERRRESHGHIPTANFGEHVLCHHFPLGLRTNVWQQGHADNGHALSLSLTDSWFLPSKDQLSSWSHLGPSMDHSWSWAEVNFPAFQDV